MRSEVAAFQVVLHNKCSSFRVESIGILFDQCLREIVDVLSQTVIKMLDDL